MDYLSIIMLIVGDIIGFILGFMTVSRTAQKSQTFMKCCKTCPLYVNKDIINQVVSSMDSDVIEK